MSKSAASKKVTTIKQAIDSFLLSCKVLCSYHRRSLSSGIVQNRARG
jgi:hypothetical protein